MTDALHAGFVELLDAAASAPDETFVAALDVWAAHTQQHFAQEESWMEAMAFGPRHCHAGQHRHVLQVVDEVRRQIVDEGRFDTGRQLVGELRDWFAWHVKTMDSLMVESLRECGIAQAV
ncbi:hemerythrin-like metal-binding domain protein [Paraburkholderia lycopersici]|uniref:Hemerythrin-like metal-binding domain protein n=2 Tax=Paraburkholderia lycopersici TaxID=416944 RepID=A0A1G6YK09_9BURK|nr:hemerythrin-like metal-binding domain protein [Paraburkholderia lycopersici]